MQKTLCAIVVGVLLGLGAYCFLTVNPIIAYPQNPREWTAEMRGQYPAEFAELSEKALKADLETIDRRIRGLEEASGRNVKRCEEAQKRFEFGRKLAADLVAAKNAGKFPVKISGTTYEEHQLQSQMKQICGELKVYQKTLTSVKKASTALEEHKRKLRLYRVECQGQLDILTANIEVFKAGQVALDGLIILSDCAETLQGASDYLAAQDPVADIETLMKRSEAEAAATAENDELDLEAFLKELTADAEAIETNDGEAEADAETTVELDGLDVEALMNELAADAEAIETNDGEAEANAETTVELDGLDVEALMNELAAAEESPAEDVPAEESPAEESPAEDVPAEEASAEESPAEEASAEDVPAEEASAEESPAEEAPAEESPAEEAPADEAPAEESPAEEASAEDVPAEESPAEDVPAEEAPAEENEAEVAEGEFEFGKKDVEFLETTISESEAKSIEEPAF